MVGGYSLPFTEGISLNTSIWLSVMVPVLSKQIMFTIPPVIILFGDMQNMFFFRNFSIANIIPNVMLTGNPGGTVMVIRSRSLRARSSPSISLCSLMIRME